MILGQPIDDELANNLIAIILFSDKEDAMTAQQLFLNCPGGSVSAGLALTDTMQHVSTPIVTVNLGLAASMGSFILAAGHPGRRMAFRNSRVMIHQPMAGGIRGQAE